MKAWLKALAGGLLLGGPLYLYARFIETRWIEVKEIDIKLKNLHQNFDGYRIAQLSDMHMDQFVDFQLVATAVDRVLENSPDLIAITGDFISHEVEYDVKHISQTLSRLKAPDGVVAIPGNHDYSDTGGTKEINDVRQIMYDLGIHDLSNEVRTLTRGDGELHICGVDAITAQKARLDYVLDALPEDGPAILLAHEPDYADIVAAYGRIDLQLSGHTHGGQVRPPFYGTIIGPNHGLRYGAGLFDINEDMQLYVNVGLGTVTYPIRFNCRPEVTIITLRPA